jgi:hypothetical protein
MQKSEENVLIERLEGMKYQICRATFLCRPSRATETVKLTCNKGEKPLVRPGRTWGKSRSQYRNILEYNEYRTGKWGLVYLARAMMEMMECGRVRFYDGWEKDPECTIIWMAAMHYGLDVEYESKDPEDGCCPMCGQKIKDHRR